MNIAHCSLDPGATVDPRTGYRLASQIYDQWHWQGFWRRNELPIVQDWLTSLKLGSILDAGTGTGLYCGAIEAAGHSAVGVDISGEMLEIQHIAHPNAILVQGSLEALPFRDSFFNNVLSTRVLTHIPVLSSVFKELVRVMKPGGQLFLADLHPQHPYSKMSIKANNQKIAIQIRKYSMDELRASLASAGFQLVDLRNHTLQDIPWKPPHGGFKNIYRDPARPIFYTARMIRP
jgi:ubiquinone/menaquinone biosynthesis C-methylase UbiE